MTNRSLNVKDLAYISVLAALCVLATFIKIPFGSGAMVHLGTGMVFTSGILFGGVYAGWAAAVSVLMRRRPSRLARRTLRVARKIMPLLMLLLLDSTPFVLIGVFLRGQFTFDFPM